MNDHQIASSLFNPASTAGNSSNTATGERDASIGLKAHTTRSHLLDARGARLTGTQREIAELMHSQQNFQFMEMNMSGKNSSKKRERDRSPDAAGGAQTQKSHNQIVSEMEQERRYLFSVVQGAPDGPEGVSKRRNRQVHFSVNEVRTTLPDMFGNVSTSQAAAMNKAAGGTDDADLWNVDSDLAEMVETSHGATGIPGITWELVPTTRVTTRLRKEKGECVRVPCLEQVGVGWRRRDALDLGRAMDRAASRVVAAAAASNNSSSDSSSSTAADVQNMWMQALLMSWDENDVFDPMYTNCAARSTGVYWGDGLTFTHDEYVELHLDGDDFQPHPTKHGVQYLHPFRFDEESTRKLLELYNRFGNFAVVADRWKFSSATGREPSSSSSMQAPCVAQPPQHPAVEDCCARYTKVSEALIEHRIAVLRATLSASNAADTGSASIPSPLPSEETKGKHARGETRPQSAAAKDSVENTVWMKMAQSHPTHRQKERREKEQHTRGDTFSTALMNARDRLAAATYNHTSTGSGGSNNNNNSSSAAVDSGSITVPKQLLQAAPWYDEAVERLRREVIALHLDREKNTNVPFERAAEHLAAITTELQNLELRVDNYFGNPDVEDAAHGNDGNKSSRANRAIKRGRGGGGAQSSGGSTTNNSNAGPQDYSFSGIGGGGGGDDSYLAMMREAASVEYFSERIRLTAQAGLLFPGNVSSNRGFANGAGGGGGGAGNSANPSAIGAGGGGVHGESDGHTSTLEQALLGNSQSIAAALSTKETTKLWANFVQVVKSELLRTAEGHGEEETGDHAGSAECNLWLHKLLAPSPLSRVFSVSCESPSDEESKKKQRESGDGERITSKGSHPSAPEASSKSNSCAVRSATYDLPAMVNEGDACENLQEELADMVLRALRGTVSTAREDLTASVNASVSAQSNKATSSGGSGSNSNNVFTTAKGTSKDPLGGALTKAEEYVNFAVSNVSECVLLTLPTSTPQLYRKVEEEMEKHLLEHHRALSDDNAVTLHLVNQSRTLYMQNLILRRFMTRVQNTETSLKKLKTETNV